MQHRIVIRHGRRSWSGLAAAVAAACIVLASTAYAAYRYGRDGGAGLAPVSGSEIDQLREERRRLTRDLRVVQAELSEIKGRSTFEARSCEIDVQACEAMRGSVATLESQLAELREQLTFYRNVAAPEQEVRAGVRILRMTMRPAGEAGSWRYELVLVQPTRRDHTASGSWDLKLAGALGKQMKTLGLSELQAGRPTDKTFAFRSFQEFSGELTLPSGFLPSRLTVTLRAQDGRNETAEVEESFDWSRLAAVKE